MHIFMFMCDLKVCGVSDCCIIFGRAVPFLWKASLKSAFSLGAWPKPSGADPSAAAAHTPLESWPGAQPSSHTAALHTDG